MTNDSGGRLRALALGGAALGGLGLGNATVLAQNDDGDEDGDGQRRYRVTVTNLTPGQPFTPPAVTLHEPSVEVFAVGDPANEPTRQVAENCNLGPLSELISEADAVRGSAVGDSPLVPENDPVDTGLPYATELQISADPSATHLTFLAMLIATNDGIVGLDTVALPTAPNESKTTYGSERESTDKLRRSPRRR
jgi:hypothetical protein